MSKRIVCILFAALFSLTWVTTAFAAAQSVNGVNPYCKHETQVRQNGRIYYMSKDHGHVQVQEYVIVCTGCGLTSPTAIEYLSNRVLDHRGTQKGNTHFSHNDTHKFYYVCSDCHAAYRIHTEYCNADETGIHVSYNY